MTRSAKLARAFLGITLVSIGVWKVVEGVPAGLQVPRLLFHVSILFEFVAGLLLLLTNVRFVTAIVALFVLAGLVADRLGVLPPRCGCVPGLLQQYKVLVGATIGVTSCLLGLMELSSPSG